jgi:hypothetical protein
LAQAISQRAQFNQLCAANRTGIKMSFDEGAPNGGQFIVDVL